MSSEKVLVPESWRTGLGLFRLLVALALAASELHPTWAPSTPLSVVYLAYAAYCAFALWWQIHDDNRHDLLRLVVDAIVLLVAVTNPPDRGGWIAALFYLSVLLSAVVLHDLREIAMVAAVVLLFSLISKREQITPLGPVFVVGGAVAVITGVQRRVLNQRLSHSMHQTVIYRGEAEASRELERQRIAADFHDGPLQSFISFQMRLEIIKRLLDRNREQALQEMAELQEICRKQITDMRAFVRSMRMSEDGAAPTTSVRQIAEDFQKTSGITLNWSVGDAMSGLEPEISHEVLQIIREALHNTQKHSKASRVVLTAEKQNSVLVLQVEDDGTGFPFGGAYSLDELELMRTGPESIKRRVRSLNGEMTVESNPGRGAVLRIRVPL
ncbi:MAG: sensor histidine kinase [Bryobacteraceae bacterium]|nr:sensor histidine kinase [Bryobacteraceae bacterium]